MRKSFLKVLGYMTGLILGTLIYVGGFSPVRVIGLLTTAVFMWGAFSILSVQPRLRKVLNPGDSKTNYSVDISDEQRPLPVSGISAELQLFNLGFRRLGEAALVNAAGQELGVEWSYISADGRVVAGVAPFPHLWGGVRMGFESLFADETWCSTMFPGGFAGDETIRHPDFWLHHAYTTIEDTYQRHLRYVAQFAKAHGESRVFQTMDEYHAMSPVFRKKGYNELMLRRGKLFRQLNAPVVVALEDIALLTTALSGLAPDIALFVLMFCLSVFFIFAVWLLQVHPLVYRIYPLVVFGLFLVFIPLLLTSPWFALLYGIVLIISYMIILRRYVPAGAKAFRKAIIAGRTVTDLQNASYSETRSQ